MRVGHSIKCPSCGKPQTIDALQLYLETMESESEMENVVLEEDLSITYVG